MTTEIRSGTAIVFNKAGQFIQELNVDLAVWSLVGLRGLVYKTEGENAFFIGANGRYYQTRITDLLTVVNSFEQAKNAGSNDQPPDILSPGYNRPFVTCVYTDYKL